MGHRKTSGWRSNPLTLTSEPYCHSAVPTNFDFRAPVPISARSLLFCFEFLCTGKIVICEGLCRRELCVDSASPFVQFSAIRIFCDEIGIGANRVIPKPLIGEDLCALTRRIIGVGGIDRTQVLLYLLPLCDGDGD